MSYFIVHRIRQLPIKTKVYMELVFVILFFTATEPTVAFLSPGEIEELRDLQRTYVWLTPDIYLNISHEEVYQQINDKNLVCALIQAESGDACKNDLACMIKVQSYAGAVGLGQIMPCHGDVKALENPGINLKFTTWYLKECLSKANGNFKEACRMYNAGLNNKRNKYKNWEYVANILNYYIIHLRNSSPKTSL